MRTLVVVAILLAVLLGAGAFASVFPWASGAVDDDAPITGVLPSYALREIRPGPIVPPTAIPTLIRATAATLRDWVPPT